MIPFIIKDQLYSTCSISINMSYQKQKESLHSPPNYSDSESMNVDIPTYGKKKKIKKESKNNSDDDDEGLCIKFQSKKKEMAKQIKRIREQNRRASHKQYVTKLQQQIKNKELEIQNLQTKIIELQQKLRAKNCTKCGNELTDLSNSSPFLMEREPQPIQKQQLQFQLDESFRRITDQSSLKLCFGNKSFLFFLVTMCCLTIGSIADNPQIFFQPIYPFMNKSQMCFLYQNEKLNSFQKYGALMVEKKNQWKFKFERAKTKPPLLDKSYKKISDLLDFQFSKFRFPQFLQLVPSIKDSTQLFLNFGTNQIFRRLLQGRNYYA